MESSAVVFLMPVITKGLHPTVEKVRVFGLLEHHGQYGFRCTNSFGVSGQSRGSLKGLCEASGNSFPRANAGIPKLGVGWHNDGRSRFADQGSCRKAARYRVRFTYGQTLAASPYPDARPP